ncbi:cathepsin L-like [Argopecten irradians]|uniref:cathepsin L-like n=1 Tax=Argopecten irradians TaxID=31199 RepID=UPI00370FE1ED
MVGSLNWFVCILVLISAVYAKPWTYPEDVERATYLFRAWKEKYGKYYPSFRVEDQKFKVFLGNLKVINKLNDQHKGGPEFALNHFADISPAEFRSTILMPKRVPPKFEEERYIKREVVDRAPESFDWRSKNMVTAVKDQGSAGSCWAFSTIGNLEGQWAMAGKKLTNFSVEQIVDCDGMEDVKGGNADCGVFGGWPYLAYQYVMKAGGLETWEDYWYCSGLGGAPGTCEVCPAPGFNDSLCGPPIPYCNMSQSCVFKLNKSKFVPGFKVNTWKAISENETVIADQLMQIGPLSVAMDAELLQFYHRGVFSSYFCSKTKLDHAVLLVGFGVEKGLFETKDYWTVKNSWGPKWGESGYFRIKRGDGMCGINTAVTTGVLGA